MIAAWQEARFANEVTFKSPLRALVSSRRWTVCVYAGSFVTPTKPKPDGTIRPPHNILRVLITETGDVILDSAGYAGLMDDPETPADSSK